MPLSLSKIRIQRKLASMIPSSTCNSSTYRPFQRATPCLYDRPHCLRMASVASDQRRARNAVGDIRKTPLAFKFDADWNVHAECSEAHEGRADAAVQFDTAPRSDIGRCECYGGRSTRMPPQVILGLTSGLGGLACQPSALPPILATITAVRRRAVCAARDRNSACS